MNILVKVARYHLVDRLQFLVLPVGVTLFAFGVNLAIFALIPEKPEDNFSGGLFTLFVFMLVCGALSMTKSLPFGLALGVSRRSYYLGTVLLVAGLSALYAVGIAVLQVIEDATRGWGLGLHYFRVPWVLDGPWYLTLLTAFVLLTLMFVYGMWYGLIYRRASVVGVVLFAAAQVLVLLGGVLLLSWTDSWPKLGTFFGTLTVGGLTGVLAVLVGVAAAGGFATMRRVTV
ncbi:ABC transporter permease [Amycolatopsis sp. BJA-103]|uniref:ABC transporter permease n=1 Tax=Amycolatopsis sp. BJA-103 TaxID=1911175 RepID=UPI000C75C67F|nr:ABC transporter permease [Amycolatopsis sp. BJA-103]AUI60929.1 ABC transporter permease [Amycolatopsis sp. BJA-103]PNE21785.1 ABC transporter permease [Amycolatopsis sp. BJA-103]